MRVLHIDTGRQMRGGQWQALHLLQGLRERSIEFAFLGREESPLFRAAASLRFDVRPLRALTAPFQAHRFDLVHAHDARAHSVGLFLRKPLVVSRRVAFPIQRTPLSALKYRRASHYLAVSECVKQILLGAGIPSDKISVVYDGVRAPDPGFEQHRTLVLALDSDDPGKGKAIVESASKLSGIPIHFTSLLLRDLPQAALFVYITELEGLGSAALLAMAYGTPVLASRVGGLQEIVDDGLTGILTDNSPQAIATAMRRLLSDRPLCDRLASRARAQVERRFTVAQMVDNTVRAYKKVLR